MIPAAAKSGQPSTRSSPITLCKVTRPNPTATLATKTSPDSAEVEVTTQATGLGAEEVTAGMATTTSRILGITMAMADTGTTNPHKIMEMPALGMALSAMAVELVMWALLITVVELVTWLMLKRPKHIMTRPRLGKSVHVQKKTYKNYKESRSSPSLTT